MDAKQQTTKQRKNRKVKVTQVGYSYELRNFGNPDRPGQVLRFIEKKRAGGEGLVIVNDGTTNAEVCRVLIDRLDNLQSRHPSDEVESARQHVETALLLLKARTARRSARAAERRHAD